MIKTRENEYNVLTPVDAWKCITGWLIIDNNRPCHLKPMRTFQLSIRGRAIIRNDLWIFIMSEKYNSKHARRLPQSACMTQYSHPDKIVFDVNLLGLKSYFRIEIMLFRQFVFFFTSFGTAFLQKSYRTANDQKTGFIFIANVLYILLLFNFQ